MIKPRREAQKTQMLENVRKEALESAITKVSAIVQQEKLAAQQAKAIEEGTIELWTFITRACSSIDKSIFPLIYQSIDQSINQSPLHSTLSATNQ